MNILVTGANGQLGNELRVLAPDYPALHFTFTDVAELDITHPEALEAFVADLHPDVIINCAAYTAVDKAEQEYDTALLINATAAGNLAKAAAQSGALLVHVSTDYVFDGKAYRPYAEDSPTGPVSAYARTKFEGERQVAALATNALIIRTSWLYSSFGHNFVKTIMKYGRERGKLNVVADQVGSPTYARDLASAILQIITHHPLVDGTAVYHYSNEGVASWYDFARAIVELAGIDCVVNPITTEEYPLPAARPFYSVFSKTKIKATFGIEIPHWRDSLQQCIHLLNP
jgi:dTDP-4-dehydrorhamnose reductase